MLDEIPETINNAICLDCMSGSCEMARVACSRVARFHAADLSTQILRLAHPGPYTRTCADVHHLPYPANTFDLVLIRGGLHHIHSTFREALGEIHRVLKPNGWLVCAEPADDNLLLRFFRETLHRVSPLYEEGERGFLRREFEAFLPDAGFGGLSIHPFGFLGYALIGNTDVIPLFASLQDETLINALISFDRVSTRIPGWRRFSLIHLVRACAVK